MESVAEVARSHGYQVKVPNLTGVPERPAPFWPRRVSAAESAAVGLAPLLVLVGHSGAGVARL